MQNVNSSYYSVCTFLFALSRVETEDSWSLWWVPN